MTCKFELADADALREEEGNEAPELTDGESDGEDQPPVIADLSEDEDEYRPSLVQQLMAQAEFKPSTMQLPWESGWLADMMGPSVKSDDYLIPLPQQMPWGPTASSSSVAPNLVLQASEPRGPEALAKICKRKRETVLAGEIKEERQSALRMVLTLLRKFPWSSKLWANTE